MVSFDRSVEDLTQWLCIFFAGKLLYGPFQGIFRGGQKRRPIPPIHWWCKHKENLGNVIIGAACLHCNTQCIGDTVPVPPFVMGDCHVSSTSPNRQCRWLIMKGLVAWYHCFCLILILYVTLIHSITFIQYIHPSSCAEVPLQLLIAGQLRGKNLPGVPSRESNSGCLTASRRTTNWATPHPNYWAGGKGNRIIPRWRPTKKRKGHLSPRS